MKSFRNMIVSPFLKHPYEWMIVALVFIFFWPLFMGDFVPKWDAIDGYLPYRYMVGEFLLDGNLPLWHPYEHLGTPLYSDLQSGAWNPIVWTLTFLYGGYEIEALVTEFLLCFIIAGIGMFRLTHYLFHYQKLAFILGVSYAFSGFMVGSSHLMVFLLGLAWLPWITYYFLRIFEDQQWKYVFYFSIVLALHVTAASPAFTILLVYFLFFVLIYKLYRKWSGEYDYLRLLKLLLAAVFFSLILLSPYLWSFYEFSPYFNRTDKLELSRFLINPFTTKEYISFLFPYTTTANTEIFSDTDLSLRNGYFGWLAFWSSIVAVFYVRKKITYVLLFGIVLSLILASGAQSGVYKYLVHLPGIGLFRHPSLYRSHTIFFGLILAGLALKKLNDKGLIVDYLKWFSVGSIVLLIGALIRGLMKSNWLEIERALQGVEHSPANASTHMAINAFILIVVVVVGIIIYKLIHKKLWNVLMGAVVLEFFFITVLLSPTTVYLETERSEVAAYFSQMPEESDHWYNKKPLKTLSHNKDLPYVYGFWRNLSIFYKRPAYDGYNPMRFKSYDQIYAHDSTFQFIIENPILYSPKRKRQPTDTVQPGLFWGLDHKQNSYTEIKNVATQTNGFSAAAYNPGKTKSLVVLNQNYHKNWSAYLDDKETEVVKINDMVMGVFVPKDYLGSLKFEFQSPVTRWLLMSSIITYLLLFSKLISYSFSRRSKTKSSSHS